MSRIYETSLMILATNGSYQFATDTYYLFFSDNNGKTWKNRINWGQQYNGGFIYNKWIDFAYIFSDGTLIFSCTNTMYRSTDQLATTPSQVTDIQDTDGSPFTFHTPANAIYPGSYFRMPIAGQTNHVTINGVEMLAWNNYGNNTYTNGAAPTVCWYTINKGATIKAFYVFGQNNRWTDNGTALGGTGGTLLGDSGNTVVCHHGHGIHWKEGTNIFYFGTGDYDTDRGVGYQEECHVFKAVYDTDLDEWTVTRIVADAGEHTRYKISGIAFKDDNIYFGSDATATSNPVTLSERGIFITDETDIESSISTQFLVPNSQEHPMFSLIFNEDKSKMVIIGEGVSGDYQTGFFVYNFNTSSNEFIDLSSRGKTSGEFLGTPYPPDSNGYIKMNIGGFKFAHKKTIFFKP